MARPWRDCRSPVHGRARHCDRERCAALDQDRPALSRGRPAVGDQRLRDRLRRLPAARRPPRRRPRPQAPVRGRAVALLDQLAPLRLRLVGGLAHRLPRPAGPRRRTARPGRALDPDDDVPRRPRPQSRARHLGRRVRQRRRGRRAARRRAHVLALLGVGLLHQRPGRRDGPRRHAVAAAREPLRAPPPSLRRRRRHVHHRRTDAARLCADPHGRRPAGATRPRSRSSRHRRCSSRRSSRSSCVPRRRYCRCASSASARWRRRTPLP